MAGGSQDRSENSECDSVARGVRAVTELTQDAKFEVGRKVRARRDILPSYRLIFAAALDRYNCKTERCDPSAKTLAADAGVSERTVRRGLACLQKQRLLWVQARKGRTPTLHFSHPQNISSYVRTYPGHSYVRTQ